MVLWFKKEELAAITYTYILARANENDDHDNNYVEKAMNHHY